MNQVLMRSLNTSLSSIVPGAVAAGHRAGLFGQTTLREFALALLIGMLTGAYSSIFVAVPLLALLQAHRPELEAARRDAPRGHRRAAPRAWCVTGNIAGGKRARARVAAGAGDGRRRRPASPPVGGRRPGRAERQGGAARTRRARARRRGADRVERPPSGIVPGGGRRSVTSVMAADATLGPRAHPTRSPDYPKPGVTFRDITPLLGNAAAFGRAVDDLVDRFHDVAVDRVVGIESRGFILAAPVAYRLGPGSCPVRKAGKLPWAVAREEYDLEYGTDKLEIHRDAIHPGERILVVDDVLATGGTAAATGRLVETLGGVIVGFGFLIELADLGGREQPRRAPRREPDRATEATVGAMATVDRVLPWRRHHETAAPAELTPLLATLPPPPPQGAAST